MHCLLSKCNNLWSCRVNNGYILIHIGYRHRWWLLTWRGGEATSMVWCDILVHLHILHWQLNNLPHTLRTLTIYTTARKNNYILPEKNLSVSTGTADRQRAVIYRKNICNWTNKQDNFLFDKITIILSCVKSCDLNSISV